MTPSIDELKQAFNVAFGEYMEAMHASRRALEGAMQSPAIEVHNAYKAATGTEEQKRKAYYEAARKMHESLVRR
jgi:hypothetical protein